MINPIQLCEVAKVHQREVGKEVALMQEAKLVESPKIFRPGLVRRLIMLSFSSKQGNNQEKAGETFSGDHLIVTSKT